MHSSVQKSLEMEQCICGTFFQINLGPMSLNFRSTSTEKISDLESEEKPN